MSLPEYRLRDSSAKRWQVLKLLGLLIIAAPMLSACAFQPLYGTTASGENLEEVMKTVDVAPIPGRVGQKLRNELIFKTTGGDGGLPTEYRLEVAVRESVLSQLVQISGNAQGQVYVLDSKFKLVRKRDNAVIFEGNNTVRAAFDKVDSIFANTRARIDAENRAARTSSETIKTRLAAFLSSVG